MLSEDVATVDVTTVLRLFPGTPVGMDFFGTLLALVHDLNNGTPATVAKKAGLVEDVVGLFAQDSKCSTTVFNYGAVHR